MARDRRLWFKVTTDIGRNSKMTDLSSDAFRAYFEALAHAKELNQDGFFSDRDAKRWMPELLELTTNHPERPSLTKVDGGWMIHDFTAHQELAEAVSRRQAASRENGRKGGRPPKPRNLEGNPGHNPGPKAESRVKSQETSTYVTESQSPSNRARAMTDSLSPALQVLARQAGIRDVPKLREELAARTGVVLTLDRTVGVARAFIERSPKPVKSGQAYFMRCLTDTPAEVEQHIHETGG